MNARELTLNEMRLDSAIKQKKGLHFMLASIVIWIGVYVLHITSLDILTKNLFTFFLTAPLLPLAFLISKWIGVDFTNKQNPLTNLGIIFAANQFFYLLIAMWIFNAVPDKMVMILAIVYGAHLMPYGWLYQSKAYYGLSGLVPVAALVVGVNFPPQVVAMMMFVIQILFSLLLTYEVRQLPASSPIKA